MVTTLIAEDAKLVENLMKRGSKLNIGFFFQIEEDLICVELTGLMGNSCIFQIQITEIENLSKGLRNSIYFKILWVLCGQKEKTSHFR
jgi:hypothetical protein